MAAAAAALPQFPPDHIPFDELVPGTIYKCVLIDSGHYDWEFGRFIETDHHVDGDISIYGIWEQHPNPALPPIYRRVNMSQNIVKFYPISLDTSAIPRREPFINPPRGELLEQMRTAGYERRRAALTAWATKNPNYRRRTNRRSSSRRRSSRRNSRK